MKKIIITAISLLLIAGCSDAYTNVSNKNETIVKIGDATITKGSIYATLLSNYGSYSALSDATEKILDAEIETTAEMESEAQETIDAYKQSSTAWEATLQMYGYKNEDDLKNSIIYSNKLNELTKKYIDENYDVLAEKFNPRLAIVLTFGDVDSANAALEELKNGIEPEKVATAYSSSTSGEPQIVTSQSTYSAEVKAVINTASANDEYAVIPSSDQTNTYIIKVLETDFNNMKEAVVEELLTLDEIAKESDKYFFDKYNFSIYDKTLYDAFIKNYPGYLNK